MLNHNELVRRIIMRKSMYIQLGWCTESLQDQILGFSSSNHSKNGSKLDSQRVFSLMPSETNCLIRNPRIHQGRLVHFSWCFLDRRPKTSMSHHSHQSNQRAREARRTTQLSSFRVLCSVQCSYTQSALPIVATWLMSEMWIFELPEIVQTGLSRPHEGNLWSEALTRWQAHL